MNGWKSTEPSLHISTKDKKIFGLFLDDGEKNIKVSERDAEQCLHT